MFRYLVRSVQYISRRKKKLAVLLLLSSGSLYHELPFVTGMGLRQGLPFIPQAGVVITVHRQVGL